MDEPVGEVWARIPDFPQYAISSDGRVLSIRTGKVRKLTSNGRGYLKVNLTRQDGVQRTRKVARLVGLLHVPNPDDKPTVNHKDRVRSNDGAHNLEWMTLQENLDYAWAA